MLTTLKSVMSYLVSTLAFIYFVWVLLILPNFFGAKVHSPYNQIDSEMNDKIEQEKQIARKVGAKEYLKTLDAKTSLQFFEDLSQRDVNHLFLVIGEGPSLDHLHLTQLVTQLDRELHKSSYGNSLLICDKKTNLKDAEIQNLSKYYPIFKTNETRSKYGWKNMQEIKKLSFINCVENALVKIKPKYITVLWESIIPYNKFVPYLNYVLQIKLDSKFIRGELQKSEEPWLYLHHHEPFNMRSFDFSFSSFGELLAIGFIGGVLFYFASNILIRGLAVNSKAFSKTIFTIYGAIVFVTLSFSIGRPYLTELRWVHPNFINIKEFYEVVPITSVTLPYKSVQKMVSYLKGLSCSPYATFHDAWDHAIGTLDIPAYVVSPSFVRYVGS